MGCSPSSRAVSARSWEMERDWTKVKSVKSATSPPRSTSGKIRVIDTMAETQEIPGSPDEEKTRDFGDKMLGVSNQGRNRLDEITDTLKRGEIYVDPEFPVNGNSLAGKDRKNAKVKWKRPYQIVKKPEMLRDGISRGDISQGNLGDCWFLSSCAAIAQQPKLMKKVIPEVLPLFGSKYRGAVYFRFWRFGQWADVVIDDSLPTLHQKPIYARGIDPNEFWVALLEKAYAKLHGSYSAIEGGQAMDALVDLTGGLAERYELNDYNSREIYHKLARAAAGGAFITCSRKGDWQADHQETDEMGLIAGHAYTVTDVKRIKRVQGTENLIRVRNPWGTGEEWKGAWSDKDHRWQLVDDETKAWLQYADKEDGEFWMAFKDFKSEFQEATICTLGPDFDGDGTADKAKAILMVHGRWEVGTTAGGCRNDINAFSTNPQYLLTVYEPDDRDGTALSDDPPDNTCSVVIGLMQEYRRSRKHQGVKMLQIGFIIYETNEPHSRLHTDHFMYNYETAKSGTYVNFREVCGRFDLEPGNYIVIPTTYNKDEDGTFLLRVYSPKEIGLKQLPSKFEEHEPPDVINAVNGQRMSMDDGLVDGYDPEITAAMRGHED